MAERKRVYAAAALASLLFLGALALSLSKSGHHRTGSNGMPRMEVVPLPPGRDVCQAGEFLPAETGRIRFFPDHRAGTIGPLRVVAFNESGTPVGGGTVPARDYEKSEAAAVRHRALNRDWHDGIVCIRNTGPRPAGVFGDFVPSPAGAATLAPAPKDVPPPWIRAHFDYHYPEATTWWSFTPTIAERFGLVKATFFGTWTFWAALIGVLAIGVAAIVYAARAVTR